MKNEKDKLEKNTISTDEEHLIIAGETEIREEVLVAKKDDAFYLPEIEKAIGQKLPLTRLEGYC